MANALQRFASLIYDPNDQVMGASIFETRGFPVEFSIEEARSPEWPSVKTKLLTQAAFMYSETLEVAREFALKADRGEDVVNG